MLSDKTPNIIILSCQKYKFGNCQAKHVSKSWTQIKENFGETLDYIFYGNLTQENIYDFNEEKKELSIKTSDEYDNIPLKTWLAYFYWYKHYKKKRTHLLTIGDDSVMVDKNKFLNVDLSTFDYAGYRLNGPKIKKCWHWGKVEETSFQYNKKSPTPVVSQKWVHEGTGVVFSEKIIRLLLQSFMEDNDFQENKFLATVRETCWYNDVLLSYFLQKKNIQPYQIPFYGIKGDRP